MEQRYTLNELYWLCNDPFLCGFCLTRKRDIQGHACDECLKVSPRRLPIVTLKDGKQYFFDKRLRQLRNIKNPHDYIDLL